jgi:hypothetical protein
MSPAFLVRSMASVTRWRELLAGRKYAIDYYEGEYRWQQKQVTELLDDLAAKFLESHEESDERSAFAEYSHYSLGSILISNKDGQKLIIDGQQRLTTVTLLLIFLQHQLEDADQEAQIAEVIFSQKYGKRSFNLDVPERAECMEGLYKGEDFENAGAPESSPTSSPGMAVVVIMLAPTINRAVLEDLVFLRGPGRLKKLWIACASVRAYACALPIKRKAPSKGLEGLSGTARCGLRNGARDERGSTALGDAAPQPSPRRARCAVDALRFVTCARFIAT